jgi:hypothetical protein
MSIVLILTLAGLSSHATEGATNPAATAVTNVAGQRAGRDVIRITNALTGFVAGSLPDVVWRDFHTNGRSTNIWEYWRLPLGWPAKPPVLRWNTNNLMWGRKGMTAISQVWEEMGVFGQIPITALTPRHGYLRGHDMGPSGLQPGRAGHRIWFCTRDNRVMERKILLVIVRGRDVPGQADYSIVLFDADLPASIEPMRVVDSDKLFRKYLVGNLNNRPVFMTLQGGYVSAEIPGWAVPFRGGDSGGPRMLPLPGELVFFGGISTSAPSPAMQADMDMLSRKAGLDPSKYQMQWVNLDSYPNLWPY